MVLDGKGAGGKVLEGERASGRELESYSVVKSIDLFPPSQ